MHPAVKLLGHYYWRYIVISDFIEIITAEGLCAKVVRHMGIVNDINIGLCKHLWDDHYFIPKIPQSIDLILVSGGVKKVDLCCDDTIWVTKNSSALKSQYAAVTQW